MRAKEFVNEDIQHLYEKGLLGKIGKAAYEFSKGAGLLSNQWGELDWLENKLGGGAPSEKDIAGVLRGQLKRIESYAEKNNIPKDNPKYQEAVKGAVESLLVRGLDIDPRTPGFEKRVDSLVNTAMNNPSGLEKAFKTAAGDKATSQKGQKMVLAKATIGPDKEGSDASIVTKDSGQWRKFERKRPGEPFKEVKLGADDIADLDKAEKAGELGLRNMEIVKINDRTINLASEKASDAADTMAKDAQKAADERETETGIAVQELKDAIMKHITDNRGQFADQDKTAEFIQHQLEVNGMTDEDMVDDVTDELMADPNMPFNEKVAGQFRAEVFAPEGRGLDSTVYATRGGKWYQFRVAGPSSWQLIGPVIADEEVAALRTLIKNSDAKPRPMTFSKDEELPSYYNLSAKAPKK